jgi:hypothetical protein
MFSLAGLNLPTAFYLEPGAQSELAVQRCVQASLPRITGPVGKDTFGAILELNQAQLSATQGFTLLGRQSRTPFSAQDCAGAAINPKLENKSRNANNTDNGSPDGNRDIHSDSALLPEYRPVFFPETVPAYQPYSHRRNRQATRM